MIAIAFPTDPRPQLIVFLSTRPALRRRSRAMAEKENLALIGEQN
jgi:hypothetical protein